jgi:hypothetical protein
LDIKGTKNMISNPIVTDGFAFRIPGMPSRYRANCSREWGCFVTGETKDLNVSQAEKAGLTRGSFVEMAIVAIQEKTLTFEPNYVNEDFTEIWGIPVSGEMKTAFHEKCSELSTFLIHRQSKDRMKGMIEIFSRNAFSSWVEEGMIGDATEYANKKGAEARFGNIFRFELIRRESGFGPYFYVKTSFRPPSGEFELAALKVARQIYEDCANGAGHCTDMNLVQNELKCLNSMPIDTPAELPATTTKALKGK